MHRVDKERRGKRKSEEKEYLEERERRSHKMTSITLCEFSQSLGPRLIYDFLIGQNLIKATLFGFLSIRNLKYAPWLPDCTKTCENLSNIKEKGGKDQTRRDRKCKSE